MASTELLIRKLEMHAALSGADKAALLALPVQAKTLREHEQVVHQGSSSSYSIIVLEGVLARYQEFADGERQCVSYHFHGEMPDLHSALLHRMDHTLEALTTASVGLVRHEDIQAAIAQSFTLGEVLWRETLIDAAIFRQWIANNGKRGALRGTAHLFCELLTRARALRLTEDDGSWRLPFTQQDIADAVGISIVHVNRIMRELRQSGALVVEQYRLRVLDWQRLVRIAGFDPTYLHLRNADTL